MKSSHYMKNSENEFVIILERYMWQSTPHIQYALNYNTNNADSLSSDSAPVRHIQVIWLPCIFGYMIEK